MARGRLIVLALAAFACLLPACVEHSRTDARHALSAELAARQSSQTDSLSYYRAGVDAYDEGDLKAARKHVCDAIAAYDRNAEAWMLLGLIEHQEDRVFEAASSFHRASMLAPDRYEPLYNIGILLESFGRYTQAIETYQAALKLSPGQLEVMENLARCYVRTNSHLHEAKDLIDRSLLTERRPQWRHWLSAQSEQLARGKDGRP
jgi:Flp pilus assembly protein TadD